jgi:acyl-CoA thioesterase-2
MARRTPRPGGASRTVAGRANAALARPRTGAVVPSGVADDGDQQLTDALDALLAALELEPIGDDRFRAVSEPARFPRLFGGQLVAQALHAACATAPGRDPHSLHAYFVQGGLPDVALELAVTRVRDGRTMATRQVVVTQGERVVLVALASFHHQLTDPAQGRQAPSVPAPEDMPTLQDWARAAPDASGPRARVWVDMPPPLEVRMGEALTFLGGAQRPGPRSHWLRLPRPVGDDASLQAVLLTYASDYFVSDMAVRAHPQTVGARSKMSSSVDHAIWLHHPVRLEGWHLYTQECLAVVGERALVQGTIHDRAGTLVATVAQEVVLPSAASA